MGELQRALNDTGVAIVDCPVSSPMLAALLKRIDDNTLSNKIAKTVFDAMWQSGKEADVIIEEQGLKQVTDTSAIEAAIDEVMAANPDQVVEYRGGKDKLMGFFVGQVMRATKGKANPQALNELLKKKLAGE
jgi:aspartyl-tRNA(Asn)/glutamyl-tRNA(Gln) amidotransferase subunit B